MPRAKGSASSRPLAAWLRSIRRDPYSAAVLIIAALLRMIAVWDHAAHSPLADLPISDSRHYLQWADAIRAGQAPDDVFFMAPLYPYVLALWRSTLGQALVVVAAVQALLGWCALWGMGQLGRWVSGRPGRRVVLTIGALYGTPVFYENKVLVTTLAVVLGTATLLALLAAERRDRLSRWIGAGLLLGLLALARPQALLFAPLAAGWIGWGSGSARRRLQRVAGFAAGTLLAITPVTLHNLAAGDLVLIASNGGINFYFGNNPLAEGTFNAPSADFGAIGSQAETSRLLAQQELGTEERLSPSAVSSYWRGRGLEFITGSPGEWLAVEVKKLRAFLSSFEYGIVYLFEAERRLLPTFWLMPLPFGLVLGACVAGALALVRDRQARLLVLFALAQLAAMMLFFVYGRFRVAMLPGLLPLAGGWALWSSQGQVRRGVMGVVALSLVIVSFTWRDPFQARQRANAECELGSAFLAQEETERAVSHFERALSFIPDFYKAHHGLARAHLARREHEAALEDLERALESGGEEDPWVWTSRGDAYGLLGRTKTAEASYRSALEIELVGPAFTGLIDHVFSKTNDWGRAASWGEQLVERAPGDVDFRIGTAYVFYQLGRLDLGRPHLEAALRIAPQRVPSQLRQVYGL